MATKKTSTKAYDDKFAKLALTTNPANLTGTKKYDTLDQIIGNAITKNYTKMNPTIAIGKNNYDTYMGKDGKYYYKKGGSYIPITDQRTIDAVANNKYVTVDPELLAKLSTSSTSTPSKTTSKSSGGGGGYGGGGGGGTASGKGSNDYYEKLLNEYKEKIDALENPKVWTADELAKHFDVDYYNMDYLNRMYNDATNKYYADAIANQEQNKKDSELSTSAYANKLLDKYLNSYKYAAPTAVGRGTLAANALSAMINNDIAGEENASNLNSIINNYKEQQKAELANNANLARDYYNTIGTWLLTRGTQNNTSEIQNYINSLNAYDTAYSGIRNAQNNLASTAAAAYQANANAALARNAYAASQAGENFRKKAFELYYGNENNAWQKAYDNSYRDELTKYTQSSSAN